MDYVRQGLFGEGPTANIKGLLRIDGGFWAVGVSLA